MTRVKFPKTQSILLGVTLLGAFLRFYNLSWGGPFFFHPDERNIASAVLNLSPQKGDLNPNFFAYGSFPIYLTYVLGVLLTLLTKKEWIEFEQMIILGRLISATLSTLLIPLVYLTTKKILTPTQLSTKPPDHPPFVINPQPLNHSRRTEPISHVEFWALIAALFTTFTPGLIQYAHFSTFEIILAFEYLLAMFFAFKIAQSGRSRDCLLCALLIGTSIATKVISLVILPILPLAHFFYLKGKENLTLSSSTELKPISARHVLVTKFNTWAHSSIQLVRKSTILILANLLLFLTALVLSPYNLLDYSSFRHSMNYEGGVATGQMPVFYTAQYLETIPVWFQLTRVFPYILGWPLTIFASVSFIYLSFRILNLALGSFKPSTLNPQPSTPILLFLLPTLYFIFHFTLFVKWTRYMIPMLPFLILMIVWSLSRVTPSQEIRRALLPNQRVSGWVVSALIAALTFTSLVQGLSFFSIYLRPDTRINAAFWASENVPQDAQILSEVWDLGITPFNQYFDVQNIRLFNFYELDTQGEEATQMKLDELIELLEKSEYIIIPSQRIYRTRLRLPNRFPLASRYYLTLFDGSLGFTKIAEFDSEGLLPRSLPCILYLGSCHHSKAEETFKVFDHPKVMIYQKTKSKTKATYRLLLTSGVPSLPRS